MLVAQIHAGKPRWA